MYISHSPLQMSSFALKCKYKVVTFNSVGKFDEITFYFILFYKIFIFYPHIKSHMMHILTFLSFSFFFFPFSDLAHLSQL